MPRLARIAAAHPELCVGERGMGLLRALVLVDGVMARDLLGPAREHGVLLTAAGPHALRFTPPLIVKAAIAEWMSSASSALRKTSPLPR